jgi:hypothetical protein
VLLPQKLVAKYWVSSVYSITDFQSVGERPKSIRSSSVGFVLFVIVCRRRPPPRYSSSSGGSQFSCAAMLMRTLGGVFDASCVCWRTFCPVNLPGQILQITDLGGRMTDSNILRRDYLPGCFPRFRLG